MSTLLTQSQYQAARKGGYTEVVFLEGTTSVLVSDEGRSEAGRWSRWASIAPDGAVERLDFCPAVNDLRRHPLEGIARSVRAARKEEKYLAARQAAWKN